MIIFKLQNCNGQVHSLKLMFQYYIKTVNADTYAILSGNQKFMKKKINKNVLLISKYPYCQNFVITPLHITHSQPLNP